MTEQKPEAETEELRLARIFFVLPEPISLPDGYQMVMATGEEGYAEARPDDPEVSLVFHQVNTTHGRTTGAMDAMMQATSRSAGLPSQPENLADLELSIEWTVVEAVTPWDSPDPIPEADLEHPAHWTPRTDLFTRCLYAARQVVRAYRQATETPYGLPTYVKAISPVLVYSANGLRERAVLDGDPVTLIRPTQEEWDGPSLMLLDHANLPDQFRGRALRGHAGRSSSSPDVGGGRLSQGRRSGLRGGQGATPANPGARTATRRELVDRQRRSSRRLVSLRLPAPTSSGAWWILADCRGDRHGVGSVRRFAAFRHGPDRRSPHDVSPGSLDDGRRGRTSPQRSLDWQDRALRPGRCAYGAKLAGCVHRLVPGIGGHARTLIGSLPCSASAHAFSSWSLSITSTARGFTSPLSRPT